jgi:hypothetical protein
VIITEGTGHKIYSDKGWSYRPQGRYEKKGQAVACPLSFKSLEYRVVLRYNMICAKVFQDWIFIVPV